MMATPSTSIASIHLATSVLSASRAGCEAGDIGIVIRMPGAARQVGGVVARRAVGISSQECQRMACLVAAAGPFDLQHVVRYLHLRRLWCLDLVENVEGAFARLAVERGRAIVAEPVIVEIGGGAVEQRHVDAVRLESHGLAEADVHFLSCLTNICAAQYLGGISRSMH